MGFWNKLVIWIWKSIREYSFFAVIHFAEESSVLVSQSKLHSFRVLRPWLVSFLSNPDANNRRFSFPVAEIGCWSRKRREESGKWEELVIRARQPCVMSIKFMFPTVTSLCRSKSHYVAYLRLFKHEFFQTSLRKNCFSLSPSFITAFR